MAELPASKPTQDVTWATAPADPGDVVEMDPSKKLAGFAFKGRIPYEEENWQRNAYGEILHWLRALAVRRFDNLYEAIDGAAENDVFLCDSPKRGWYAAAHQNNTNASAISKICTDGRVVITVDGQMVRGEPNEYAAASFGSTALWAYDASSEAGVDVLRASTDGVVVAFANGTTGTPPSVVIVTTAGDDGGIAYEDVSTGYCYAVCADSVGGDTPRVWWGTFGSGGTAKVYRWTGGARVEVASGYTTIHCICATTDFLFIGSSSGGDANLAALNKSDFSTAWNHSPVSGAGARSQAVCSDGELVFFLVDGAGGSAAPKLHCYRVLGVAGAPIWTATGGTNHAYGSALRVECDHRYVYARWRVSSTDCVAVFDKLTGAILQLIGVASLADFCVDGRSLMVCTGDGRVYYRGTDYQAGLWVRRDGYDETRNPAKRLALVQK